MARMIWVFTLSRTREACLRRRDDTSCCKTPVTAFRAALEIRTKDGLPQDWAITQSNLDQTLGDLGN